MPAIGASPCVFSTSPPQPRFVFFRCPRSVTPTYRPTARLSPGTRPECCHDRDCRPVVRVQVVAAGLWMTTDDGQTVLIGPNEERRRSRDMRWHICLAKDLHNNLIVQCLFEPANS